MFDVLDVSEVDLILSSDESPSDLTSILDYVSLLSYPLS